MKYILALILIFSIDVHADNYKKDCYETRVAFDLGSGTTRMKVAKIDLCAGKIEKILAEEYRKVYYKEDLLDNKDQFFSQKILKKGLSVLKELKALAMKYKPQKWYGVCTSAFRKASNTKPFLDKVKKELGIKFHIISQEDEGRLGFLAATEKVSHPRSQLVVWDIGGGSMQLVSQDPKGELNVYKGNVASVGFKNQILTKIQKKDSKKNKSPNPISFDDMKKARAIAENIGSQIPEFFRQRISDKSFKVVGIGGVHYHSVKKQTGDESVYSLETLEKALKKQLGKTDEQIGGKYASTDVSNLILVYGIMKSLKLNQVMALRINLTDGIFLEQKYWD